MEVEVKVKRICHRHAMKSVRDLVVTSNEQVVGAGVWVCSECVRACMCVHCGPPASA